MCSTLNSYSRNKDDSVEPATHVAQKEGGKNDRNGEAMAMGTVDRGVMLSDRSRVPRIDKLFRRSANARAQHPRPLCSGRLHARQHDHCDCVSCIGNVIYFACSSSHGYALDYNEDRFAMLVIFRSPRGRAAAPAPFRYAAAQGNAYYVHHFCGFILMAVLASRIRLLLKRKAHRRLRNPIRARAIPISARSSPPRLFRIFFFLSFFFLYAVYIHLSFCLSISVRVAFSPFFRDLFQQIGRKGSFAVRPRVSSFHASCHQTLADE